MASVVSIVEQILETSFTMSNFNADSRITHFTD